MPDCLKFLAHLAFVLTLSAFTSPAIRREQEMLNPTVLIDLPSSMGSGSVLYSGEAGTLILTNHHVVEEVLAPSAGAQPIKVKFWIMDEAGDTVSAEVQAAEVVAFSEAKDLALLRIKDRSFRSRAVTLMAPPDAHLLAGEDVYLAGAGLGHRVFLTHGLLGVVEDEAYDRPALLSSAPMVPGNSGGSLWHQREDGRYEMIGVPQAIDALPVSSPFGKPLAWRVTTMGYSIPMRIVRIFLDQNGFEFVGR
jgi:S1-C subfamily serine protease